jgi:DNA-binding NarL/FixJ family response regulator
VATIRAVLTQRGSAHHWGFPASRPVSLRLAVISDDETLAGRATGLLERDGLVVRLEANGPDISAIDGFDRRPSLLIVRRAADHPGLDHILRWARRRLPQAIVIVVLPAGGRSRIDRLLAGGAGGLVFEQDLEATLAAVVRGAAAGQISVPARLRHMLQPPELSGRERQVLGLAVTGSTNAQIASRLFLAESTVKAHLASAFRRLGVHSRREAATLVLASDDTLRRTVLATLTMPTVLADGEEP